VCKLVFVNFTHLIFSSTMQWRAEWLLLIISDACDFTQPKSTVCMFGLTADVVQLLNSV
jgi:hypothetical protein